MSTARIIYSANVLNSFNKRSDELKARVIELGLQICQEWDENGYHCFTARNSQDNLKAGKGVYSEVSAHLNHGYARIEKAVSGGKILATCIHPK